MIIKIINSVQSKNRTRPMAARLIIIECTIEALLWGGLNVPILNFKPFLVAISKGSHVAVGILNSFIATDNIKNKCGLIIVGEISYLWIITNRALKLICLQRVRF